MRDQYEGSLLFITDPICSWCWGMLPEIFLLREAFQERLDVQLKLAGLQMGSQKNLDDQQTKQLIELWQRVAETTGQMFTFALPADSNFIYHSELACRALHIAKLVSGEEPWDLFHKVQEAFYVHSRNITNRDELYNLIQDTGIDQKTFNEMIQADRIVKATRKEFGWCRAKGTGALPTLLLDIGKGPRLISGGYATAEYLIPEIKTYLHTH